MVSAHGRGVKNPVPAMRDTLPGKDAETLAPAKAYGAWNLIAASRQRTATSQGAAAWIKDVTAKPIGACRRAQKSQPAQGIRELDDLVRTP